MKTQTKRKITTKNNESGSLEILEKKVNIQMKRLEMRNDRIALDLLEPRKIAEANKHVLIAKISELRALLTEEIIDEERTVFGGEPINKSILEPEEKKLVKTKLRELINKF